jgi:L,D-transpeptidase YcbB
MSSPDATRPSSARVAISLRLSLSLMIACSAVAISACGGSSGAPPGEVQARIETKVAALKSGTGRLHGRRLLAPKAVARFYAARGSKRVWSTRGDMEQIIESIRDVKQDGLTPADYHLDTLLALMQSPDNGPDAGREADLDVLLTDAVAGIVDHMRYGRVRPAMLNATWNVDPRADAPPLEQTIAEIVGASSPSQAIAAQRPQHFIYRGLVEALARLREIAANGGWPAVPLGKTLKPGGVDRRVPLIRARLAVTGEYRGRAGADSLRYDPELEKAVELFQAHHRLEPNGVVDKATTQAMSVPASHRVQQVRVNLERARWVLPGLTDDFVLVNLPAYKVYLIRGGKNVWEARTQIGKEARQTPTFRAKLNTVVFNPDWTVPPTILAEDVLDGMREGKNVLAEKKLTILDGENRPVDPSSIDWDSATPESFPYTLRQPPGEGNALGRVKFLFPNPYSIYLHDTPSRELFEADRRTFSSGCIRVEHALDLALMLLQDQGWTRAKIAEALETIETRGVTIEHPLPILIVYWTVSVGASGEIRYMNDIYGQDAPLLDAMEAPPRSA